VGNKQPERGIGRARARKNHDQEISRHEEPPRIVHSVATLATTVLRAPARRETSPPQDLNRSRARVLAVGAVLAALSVTAVVEWTTHRGSAPPAVTGEHVGTFAPPVAVPVDTSYVRTTVLKSGVLEVEHWIHTSSFVFAVTLRIPEVPAVPAGEIAYSHLVLASEGRQLQPREGRAGNVDRRYTLPPTNMLYVSYHLSGALQRTGSTAGRGLARLTSLDVELGSPLARSIRTVGGTHILALACYPSGAAAVPLPCGVQRGDTWRVDLGRRREHARVMAQVDLT
jgi:hypothetical protein